MANWAQNQLFFSGEKKRVREVRALFSDMATKCQSTNEGQKPDFMDEVQEDFFFDVVVSDDEDQISYNTKWSSNVSDLVTIAKHHKVNFVVTYQERADSLYGKAVYTAGNSEAEEMELKAEDWEQFQEENDGYIFRGKIWESEDEILDTIFKERFKIDY